MSKISGRDECEDLRRRKQLLRDALDTPNQMSKETRAAIREAINLIQRDIEAECGPKKKATRKT